MLVSILAGFVIGTAFGLYLLYAIVTPEGMLGGAKPHQLFADGVNPQYRDYYAARAAARFSATGGSGAPQALKNAQDELGVSSGDITPLQALELVRAAQAIAVRENATEQNPDTGRFTLQDQQNLAALGDRLDAAKNEPGAAQGGGRTLLRTLGALGLLLLIGLTGLLLWALTKMLQPAGLSEPRASVRMPSRVSADDLAAERERAAAFDDNEDDETEDVERHARAVPADAMAVTAETEVPHAVMRTTAPVAAANETLLGTFNTSYLIGDDRYDESFPINGSMGELIGECGASVVERIGHDTPAKVAALAIWLFDKSDFQSTTKVLMTEFAHLDEAIKERLKNRGDSLPARNGVFDIVSSSMRAEVEVNGLDVAPYGGATSGYFEKVNLQFRVFKKG